MAESLPLPPWLTHEYDYASGLRQTGQIIANNLQRKRQLEIQAIQAAAQAQQAEALERYRMQQAQALQEKSQREADDAARYETGVSSVLESLNGLGADASSQEKANVILKNYRNLPPGTFNSMLNALGRESSIAGAGERQESANETRMRIAEIQEKLKNDPNNPQLLARLRSLDQRDRALDIANKNLEYRGEQIGQAGTRLNQSAVGRAAALAEQGYESNIPLLPQRQAQPTQAAPEVVPPYLEEGVAPQPKQSTQGQAQQPLIRQVTRPLTATNVTRNQASLSDSLTALNQIQTIKPLINAETMGPIGAAKRIIVNRGLANIFPELVDKDSVTVDQLLTTLGTHVVKALKSDSNIAEPERRKLESTIPSQREILQSPANAYQQLINIADRLKESSVRSLIKLKEPVPDELTAHLSSEDVKELVKAGSMTPVQALRWYQLNRKQ